MKPRNPIAKSLRSAHLRPKVIKSKKVYDRKKGRSSQDGPSSFYA